MKFKMIKLSLQVNSFLSYESNQGLVVFVLCLMLITPVSIFAQITVGATTSSTGSGSSLTFSHTPGSGSNQLMLVGIGVGSTGPGEGGNITSVTYNSTAMTQIGFMRNDDSEAAIKVYLYALENPVAGPANVVVSVSSSSSSIAAGATTFKGVNISSGLASALGTVVVAPTGLPNALSPATTGSVTVSSAVNELVYAVGAYDEDGTAQSITTPGGQTELWTSSGFNYVSAAGSTEPGAASVTMTYTAASSQEWGIVAVPIKPVVQTIFPGGVATNNPLWLKADAGTSSTTDGATVTTWTNSAVGGEVSTASAGQIPLYRVTSSNFNFNPLIDFDGVDDYYAGTSNFGVTGTSLFTAFAVSRRATDASIDMLFGGNAAANNNFGFFIHSNDLGILETTNFGTRTGTNATALAGVGTIKGVNRSASNTWQLYHNGAADGASGGIGTFAGTLANSNLNIGVGEGTQGPFDGEIAEIVIYSSSLTNAEMNRVQSYLGIKYGISLDQTVAQNYTAADGSTIFWNGTANSGYKNNIAGIARDDASALSQKQSKSINSGLQVVMGNGNTIAATNALNANGFSADKSALVWGDNAGSVASWTATGAPSLRQIVARTWKVQETGTVGSVKVQVADNSGSNGLPAESTTVYLLTDTDGDFTSGATETAMTLNGTNWEVNKDFMTGQYFTFATLNTAPVDLNLTMTVNNSTVVPGGTLQYVLTLTNSGTTTATNVKVRDQLPGGVTYTSHTASTGSYDPATGIWTLPVVVPGTATLTLNVIVQ
jgi:uncharacterized repeat protein (TIGR01451 family)